MTEMKTLNGFEIVDAKAREDIEALKSMEGFDLSDYAKKEDIPSVEGLASEEYVTNAIANIPENRDSFFLDFSNATSSGQTVDENMQEFINFYEANNREACVYMKDTHSNMYLPASHNYVMGRIYLKIMTTDIDNVEAPVDTIAIYNDTITYKYVINSTQDNPLATKEYVQNEITTISAPDLTSYATQTYVEEQIAEINIPTKISELDNDTGYATQTWVENKKYLTEHQDISGKSDVGHKHTLSQITDYKAPDLTPYALKTEIPTKLSQLGNDKEYVTAQEVIDADYTDKTYVDTKTSAIETNVYNLQKEVDTLELTHQADINTINGNLNNNYWTSTRVSQEITSANNLIKGTIPTKVSDLTNDSSYVTANELAAKGYLDSTTADTLFISNSEAEKYVTQTHIDISIDEALTPYSTTEQVKALIPTKVSQLTNDANYANNSDLEALDGRVSTIESNYVTENEMASAIYNATNSLDVAVKNIKDWNYHAGLSTTGVSTSHMRICVKWTAQGATTSYKYETYDISDPNNNDLCNPSISQDFYVTPTICPKESYFTITSNAISFYCPTIDVYNDPTPDIVGYYYWA